jgi:mannose-6-phosphate isomerase-like protein (cupin superfamily)
MLAREEARLAAQSSALDITTLARENEDFRREVVTAEHSQIVLMTIRAGEEIGEEVHEGIDQILVFVEGRAEAVLEGEKSPVEAGQVSVVRAGTRHNFVNVGDGPLRLWTVYAPPEHPVGTVHRTKAEADAAEH